MKLSVVIPSYKDPLLHKTIDSLLDRSELGMDLEVIVVLDGYWPATPIRNDPRIKICHLGSTGGMRNAINSAVALATGEFIMRTDEHCMFAQGYDKTLTEVFEDNWIMTATRFFLDPVKWEVMALDPVIHEKLIITAERQKFSAHKWPARDEERKDFPIDETMAMQGSMWIMKKAWWEKVIKELQSEGYGTHYQDSVEMLMKTWQAGGKLMVNRKTWFAHKHRSFPRTHNYGGQLADASFKYALDTWRPYYEQVIKPQWKT